MSDERDETRQFSRSDDATRTDGSTPSDGAVPGGSGAPAERTRAMPAVDDWAAGRGNPAWAGRAEVRAPQSGGTQYQDGDWPGQPSEPRDRWWMPIVIGIVTLVLLGALGWGVYLIVQNSGAGETPAPATTSAVAPQPGVTTGTVPAATETTSEPAAAVPTATPTATTTPTTDSTAAIRVPALKGRSLAEAQSALNSVGLSYRLIYRTAEDAAPDTVIDSDPFEGQEVPPDTRVALVVAAPPQFTPPSSPTTGLGQ